MLNSDKIKPLLLLKKMDPPTKSLWKDKIKAPDEALPGERDPSGKCKECGKFLKMKNSSTGALRSHLKCHKEMHLSNLNSTILRGGD